MDAGNIVEFDHPYNLLNCCENGFFYKMVEETGESTANLLHSVAAEVLCSSFNHIVISADVTNCSIFKPNRTHNWKYSTRIKHKVVRFEYRIEKNDIPIEFFFRYPICCYNSKKFDLKY